MARRMLDSEYWELIDEIPDHHYWSLHQALKTELLKEVCGARCSNSGATAAAKR